MKLSLPLLVATIVGVTNVTAQTPDSSAPTQSRPDARYAKPSGQDSNPGKTTVKPTKTAPNTPATLPPSVKPGGYTAASGKKPDTAPGCSTPTDAQSAHVDTGQNPVTGERGPNQTVCTTSGADSSSAREPRVAEKPTKKTAPTPPQQK